MSQCFNSPSADLLYSANTTKSGAFVSKTTAAIYPPLESFAELFVAHRAHLEFGICLLHRHQTVEPDHVMVHSQTQQNEDLCTMEAFESRKLFACFFFVREQGQILPLEYSAESQPVPADDFLCDVFALLFERNLQDTFAVSCLSTTSLWIERPRVDGLGTISTQVNEEEFESVDGVHTEWAIAMSSPDMKIVTRRKCVEPEGGGHKTVKDQT